MRPAAAEPTTEAVVVVPSLVEYPLVPQLEAGEEVRRVESLADPAESFEKASRVSGKLGGVAGVFAGVIICSKEKTVKIWLGFSFCGPLK